MPQPASVRVPTQTEQVPGGHERRGAASGQRAGAGSSQADQCTRHRGGEDTCGRQRARAGPPTGAARGTARPPCCGQQHEPPCDAEDRCPPQGTGQPPHRREPIRHREPGRDRRPAQRERGEVPRVDTDRRLAGAIPEPTPARPRPIQQRRAREQQADLGEGRDRRVQGRGRRVRAAPRHRVDQRGVVAGEPHEAGARHAGHQREADPDPALVKGPLLMTGSPPAPDHPWRAPCQVEPGPTDPVRRPQGEAGRIQGGEDRQAAGHDPDDVGLGHLGDASPARRQGDVGSDEPEGLGRDAGAISHDARISGDEPGNDHGCRPRTDDDRPQADERAKARGRAGQRGRRVRPTGGRKEDRHRRQHGDGDPPGVQGKQVGAADLAAWSVDHCQQEMAENHQQQREDACDVDGVPVAGDTTSPLERAPRLRSVRHPTTLPQRAAISAGNGGSPRSGPGSVGFGPCRTSSTPSRAVPPARTSPPSRSPRATGPRTCCGPSRPCGRASSRPTRTPASRSTWARWPRPELAPDEVYLGVMASSINFNTVWTSIFEPLPTFGFLDRLGKESVWGKRHALDHHVVGSDAVRRRAARRLRGAQLEAGRPGHGALQLRRRPGPVAPRRRDARRQPAHLGLRVELRRPGRPRRREGQPADAEAGAPHLGGERRQRAVRLHQLPHARRPSRRPDEAGRLGVRVGRHRRHRRLRRPARAERWRHARRRGVAAPSG